MSKNIIKEFSYHALSVTYYTADYQADFFFKKML